MGSHNLENAISYKKPQIKAGNYSYEQVRQDIMRNQFGTPSVTPDEVIAHIQKYDENFKLPDGFAQQREQREALAIKAREKLVDRAIFEAQNSVDERYRDLLPQGGAFRRHERTIVYMGNTEEELRFNDEYMKHRFKTDPESKAEIRRMVMERIEKASRTVEEARGYTTEELVEHYDKIAQDINLIVEIQAIKNNTDYGFSQEELQRLNELDMLTSVATYCESSVTTVSSVWYPDVPLESLSLNDYFNYKNGSNHLELMDMAKQKGEPERVGGALGTTAMAANDIQMRMHCKAADVHWVAYTIQKGGSDSRMIFDVNGRQLGKGDDDSTYAQELMGYRQPLIVGTADKGFVTVAVDRTKDPTEFIYDDPELNSAVARSMSDRTEQMLKQITDATPWWMTTGSRQFKEMTEAMKAFAAAAKDLTFPLDGDKAQQLREASARMKACSEEYIAYKNEQREGQILDESGNYRGKNDRETRRLQAADELKKMCDSMNVLLRCEKGNTEVVEEMVNDLRQQDALKAQEEKAKEEREAQQKKADEEKYKVPKDQRCTRNKEDLLAITGEIRLGEEPKSAYQNDMLPEMYKNAKSALERLPTMASLNKKFGGHEKFVIEFIGNFIRYDLVQQERALYRQNHDGASPTEPLSLEKLLTKSGTLKESDPVLREMIGTVTPKRIEEIIVNGDLKRMGQQYLDKVQEKVKQKENGDDKKIEKLDDKKIEKSDNKQSEMGGNGMAAGFPGNM